MFACAVSVTAPFADRRGDSREFPVAAKSIMAPIRSQPDRKQPRCLNQRSVLRLLVRFGATGSRHRRNPRVRTLKSLPRCSPCSTCPPAHCSRDKRRRSLSRCPCVLLIGDSISLGYTPFVKELLKDEASVEHHPGNAQHTGTGLEKLDGWLGDKKWDVIHFNWGLWDLCYRHPEAKTGGNRDKVQRDSNDVARGLRKEPRATGRAA